VTALPSYSLNPLGIIGRIKGLGLRFKNIKMSFAQAISINIKLLALELIRAERVILYLFFNKVYRTIKCQPSIN
jgi:hypothetical protein